MLFRSALTNSLNFGVSYELYADTLNRFSINAGITKSSVESFFDIYKIDVQSYDNTKINAGIDYSFLQDNLSIFTSISYNKGIKFISKSLNDTKPEFLTFLLNLSLHKGIFGYSFSAYAQGTKMNLPANDMFSVGGVYSVRGFMKEGISGNSGGYIRNEASLKFNYDNLTLLPYAALDAGIIKEIGEKTKAQTIAGGALGVKFIHKHFDLNLEYQKPLYTKDVSQSGDFFGISAKVRL